MADPSIFTVGGTVQAGSGIYLPRPTDDEFLQHCLVGNFCYVLTARQMGKSSLMVRTAERLNAIGTRTAIIDLTSIGINLDAEQWYLGLVDEIVEQLKLDLDYKAWWELHAHLGITQRLSRFLRETMLINNSPLVIFIDEIDTTLKLPFADDIFAVIRACYNARSTDPAYRHLSFVLLGVATPSDLIRDPQRTPFNIGQRIDLNDFSLEQILPLAPGLGLPPEKARKTLDWVLHWTSGHPYLTQRLCRALVERNRAEWDESSIARVVEETFFGERSKQDGNLLFVRDMLTSRAPDVQKVLQVYQDVCAGKTVKNNDQSLEVSHLKISGIVRVSDGELKLRNRIYKRVFNQDWIVQSTPLPDSLTRLQIKAIEWGKTKDASRLLRGKELREAEAQLAKSGSEKDSPLIALQRQYLLSSQKNEKRVRSLSVSMAIASILITIIVASLPTLTSEKAVPGTWVSIPAGAFTMGMDEAESTYASILCLEGALDSDKVRCSSNTTDILEWSGRQVNALLSEFSIMENEVTNAQYQQCVDANACLAPEDWLYEKTELNQPATNLNWFQAGAYCEWLGGRLPTESEWEKAARGAKNYSFPWGNVWDPSKANLEQAGIGTVQRIVQYAASDISGYGIKNMAGNVREWTASEASPLALNQTFSNIVFTYANNSQDWPVIVRGGSWLNVRSEGMTPMRGTDSILSRRETLGFRCACPNGHVCRSPWTWKWIWFGITDLDGQPYLTATSLPPVATATYLPSSFPAGIFVDTSYSGIEDGTELHPYNTVNEGRALAQALPTGAWLFVKQSDGTWSRQYISPVTPPQTGGGE